jgi:hypothetical protein
MFPREKKNLSRVFVCKTVDVFFLFPTELATEMGINND